MCGVNRKRGRICDSSGIDLSLPPHSTLVLVVTLVLCLFQPPFFFYLFISHPASALGTHHYLQMYLHWLPVRSLFGARK